MIPSNITKEHLMKAIVEIDRNGIRSGRHSSTYDLVYNSKRYPPKLVISIANKFSNGEELDPNEFKGGGGTAAFNLLTKNGFRIERKLTQETYFSELKSFLNQAKTDNLKTKHFVNIFQDLKVKVSFGQGVPARIPWISFLKSPNTTSKGIYPVYLFYKNLNKLILAYGISETNNPPVMWDIINQKNIKDYFKSENLGRPQRYGDSLVFKVYDVENLPSGEEIDKDLHEIIETYKDITIVKGNTMDSKKDFDILSFYDACSNAGLKYNLELLTRFTSSLLTKPFLILTGLSGSGKTKLAQSFVQWICQDRSQYRIVPVGPDWTNREPLLGYPNSLNSKEYIKPENGVIELLIQAIRTPSLPHFLILDEMNLSHVERYFADFLSVMESKEKISLHSDNKNEKSGVPAEIEWPDNLFLIGTVNIDETTYMFSPKVLDRSNVIEFRIKKTELEEFLADNKELTSLDGEGSNMAVSFCELFRTKSISDSELLKEELIKFFEVLQKVGAEFGYRTANEIQILFSQLSEVNPEIIDENFKIDIAIMQKLLPKLHGSRRKLEKVLIALGSLCYEGDVVSEIFESDNDVDYSIAKYGLSLEKITRMYKSLLQNGFASYAEA